MTGTLNVLLAARDEGVRRVVFASSSSTYGANRELPAREQAPALPISPYAVGKLAAEGYCRAFFEVFGLQTVSLRYFNVFGPRQDPLSEYAAVIPRFITAMLTGRPPQVHGDGEQSRDFTYVDNAVAANLLAAERDGVAGETFNIACGETITLNALLEELRGIIGVDAEADYGEPRPACGIRSPTSPGRATPWATSPRSDCAKAWRGPWSRCDRQPWWRIPLTGTARSG